MIVVSSQFLIDSESSLKASLQRMEPVEQPQGMESMQGMGSMGSVGSKGTADEMTSTEEGPGESNTGRPIMGVGVVKEIKPADHKLNIQHDPIAALNWPSMTMDFDVNPDVSLEDIHPGDRIHFGLVKSGASRYVINTIHNMGGGSGNND